MEYLVVIEPAADGSFSAYAPDLPDCVSSGDTAEEVRTSIREAVELHIKSLRRRGEAVPPPSAVAHLVLV